MMMARYQLFAFSERVYTMKKNVSVMAKACIAGLGLLLAVGIGYGIGKYTGQAPVSKAAEPVTAEPALRISVVEDPQAEWSTLLEENTEDSFTRVSLKNGIAEANIELDGESIPLADALESGRITQEEIACLARLDAKNGCCEQTHATQNGLTHFTYQYPGYNLRVVYDVYVTPDGGEDLINHITIYPVRENENFGPYVNFYDPVTGQRTDLEDWGLTFQTISASANEISVHCEQSGGQQIGQLSVDWYSLTCFSAEVPELKASPYSPLCNVALNMNGETSFTLDWTEEYGPLPSGKYRITFHVIDHFEESDVHPLMQDYHDWQAYNLEFTIP